MGILSALFGTYSKRELKRIQPICDRVLALEDKYKNYTDEQLRDMTDVLRGRLSNGETTDDILPDAFAVCREASARVLNMRHFPVQIIGGIVLHQGRIAEMRTGEGKTLVATLPAYLNALTGKGVHVVTVNDYLARRDSEWMGKVYRFLGLTVGLIVHGIDSDQRRAAYAADITYGTNNEFGFDYLRDNMAIYKQSLVQRSHHFAIVDEVDSILVDEARTPLIISGHGEQSTDLYRQADRFVRTLRKQKVRTTDDKEDNDALYADADYIVDEKARTVTLTANGTAKAERYFNLENLSDPENTTYQHHINQAIRAHGIMSRDVDYVVKDGQVIIVDEFTGRLMFGRRFNEGLHQAIEAKENVKVERESKTLATITFQNYFRLYEKLSGMTGTAMTEEQEFREIYNLDVIEIPTNRPIARKHGDDCIYATERGKFNAIVEYIAERHATGQPVLVGTISIEKSELLSAMLKRRGIPHEVLNAKHHEKEAEIVSQAGKPGAVTIATNMAGRGTDITLGGNAEYLAKAEMRRMQVPEELIVEATGFSETDNPDILAARATFTELNEKYRAMITEEAEKVRAAGGLCIIGTERHESRRIDNQLRGRAGRQGDPGESRFYLSLEDDLMRLFGGERLQVMMERLHVEEDMPIESTMVSGTVENAQKKLEARNFGIRKNVLQYDDVMSRQREVIYGQRNQVLNGEDLREQIRKMVHDSIAHTVETHMPANSLRESWAPAAVREKYKGLLTTDEDLIYTPDELEDVDPAEVTEMLNRRAMDILDAREAEVGSEIMRELERVILLKNVDRLWIDHIDAMEELKRGIGLRAYAQRDPVVEYRMEGFDMFDAMINEIRGETARLILTVRLHRENEEPKREQVAKPAPTAGDGTDSKQPVRKKKIGRNDPCPCGSGLKYKKCCGRDA